MAKIIGLILLLSLTSVWAKVEVREFDNPDQEKSYRQLINELRCLVCQNQNIADSNADLAKDLRRQVYEMLRQGKSEKDILDFMLQRYGDFVLYKPQLKAKTLVLWLGPIVFLIIGAVAVFSYIKRRRKTTEQSILTEEEKSKIRQLLHKDEEA